MRKNLSRSDGRYKEIEKFKDYELTQCIAYEMAVRNEEIKELAYKRDSTSILNMFDETWIKRMNTISTKEEEDEILDEFTKIAVANIEMYKENQRLRKEIIEKSYFDIANQKGSKINDLLSNVFYKDYVSRETQRIQAKKSHLIDTGSMKYAFTDEGKADTKKKGVIKYDELYPVFSRHIPIIPEDLSKEIDIVINMALPKNEILSYIDKIKSNYDKNPQLFKSASLLSSLSSIDKEIFTIKIKTKKKGSSSNLNMPEKKQQEVYADLFFLYDVMEDASIKKQKDKFDHFRYEMIMYYGEKVRRYYRKKDIDEILDHISTPRDQSIREYYKVMKYYIDEYGYKTLLV